MRNTAVSPRFGVLPLPCPELPPPVLLTRCCCCCCCSRPLDSSSGNTLPKAPTLSISFERILAAKECLSSHRTFTVQLPCGRGHELTWWNAIFSAMASAKEGSGAPTKRTALHDLYELQGLSPWYDNLCRPVTDLLPIIASGVRGVTSNPTVILRFNLLLRIV